MQLINWEKAIRTGESFLNLIKSSLILDCNYTFPIYFAPNRFPFDVTIRHSNSYNEDDELSILQ